MSDYTVTAVWGTKDALATGEDAKAISATELGVEFDAIETASATKYDVADRDVASGLCPLDAGALVPAGNLPAATESAIGALEIATDSEAATGSATDKIITPEKLEHVTSLNAGIVTDLINLSDPGADRILFWDDGAGTTTFLTASTGISITGTDLTTNDAEIDHDALDNFVANEHINHTSVSITGGVGLSGGGTIAASRSLDLDFAGLSNVEGSSLAAGNEFAVDVGGTPKSIAVRDMGFRVQTGQSTQTLVADDMNTIMEFTSTSTLTLPINSSVDLPIGVPIVLNMKHATGELTVDAAASVTLVSVFHPAGTASASDVVVAGGTALIYKTAANVWCITGDISDT